MNKYGADCFQVETVEECDDSILEEREKFYITYFNTRGKTGYNATYGGDGKSYIDVKLILELYERERNISTVAKITGHDCSSIHKILKNNQVIILSSAQVMRNEKGISVDMLDKDSGIFIRSFQALNEARQYIAEQRKIINDRGIAQHIKHVCEGKRKTAYGYKWQYAI